ncbi:hypothetical protein A2331_05290 [Candidatus Falkowbacteria bacterium RIFOXYB2_FULL_34_18]|uniref:Glycogen synthase n=1 Tax=Candidatus Falkowbacteria bacterium RIFOXYD2_FULL_34_120 TaxID=1798007 RepID=A0A1F5TQM4_9BACT|nr:MAG: hypothetical protein A2331_05290 [Candidatus Falkowbacteria bacterium RIFOXYB2_FULL_34_18]OGF29501.1 MAG: hypothetical protein A2500_04155 [Candidatus Falkowbacteria bacterium RIFOXYC12_FULL_34_55]OGF36318.1 MAG: hypothetical protein A2466_05165 [Candidatus Falkowbacteria bacterium RIFOXYC2_FULL_34_220]OGF39027.1 MAG: hypothetical protein A2515_06620 [Candidatus Falkowbacteria bacterium RIFOXYD12_FULL_34_57]OGF41246.1 MAG: hypothetical protein A2531_00860 [Candidatus Falkowbacteria bact
MKIWMPSAEVAPFAKVGGLGDVAGSLPPALKKLNCDIRLIMPLYGLIDREKYKLKKIYENLEVPSGRCLIKVDIWESFLPGTRVPIYFIDAPEYFKFNTVYARGDNSERFLFFSFASLYILPIIGFNPDVVHCQDSHTAMIPDILKNTDFEFLRGIKTVFTIHNLNYQGVSEIEVLSTGNLHVNSLKTLSEDAKNGDINYMMQGILNADIVNTVSEKYVQEIMTSTYGAGLDKEVRKRKKDLYGVLNGIDVDFFDPAKDKFIFKNYSINSLGQKYKNKLILQKKLGLPQDKDRPLVGLVSRLVWQKGLELITEKLSDLDCQFVFLGTGKHEYEEHLKGLNKKFPRKFSAQIKFDLELAQQIYAGSDMFLMPSRFEPCGLGQMIAMRYGSVPVVRATGGLADTVDSKVGFVFKDISKQELFDSLQEAIDIFCNHPGKWRKMQVAGMKRDFSWKKSAKEYVKLYKKAMKK